MLTKSVYYAFATISLEIGGSRGKNYLLDIPVFYHYHKSQIKVKHAVLFLQFSWIQGEQYLMTAQP